MFTNIHVLINAIFYLGIARGSYVSTTSCVLNEFNDAFLPEFQ